MKINRSITHIILFLSLQILYSAIVYVTVDGAGTQDGSSWENALPGDSLQVAIDMDSTNQVWVEKGTYKPTGWPAPDVWPDSTYSLDQDRKKHFSLKKGVELYGGFLGTETELAQRDYKLNETILTGDLGLENINTDNCYHVLLNIDIDIDSTAVIDGFTISDGYEDTLYLLYGGAGMLNCTNPTIRNCRFKNNQVIFDYGGAICFMERGYSHWEFSKIENCIFENNTAQFGGAIYLSDALQLKMNSCTFINNSAEYGGAIAVLTSGQVAIANSLFYGNESGSYGYGCASVLRFDTGQSLSLINNTFVNNTDNNGESVISIDDCYNSTLTNNVIWNNNVPIIFREYGTYELDNNAISNTIIGEYTGENNITLSLNNAGDPNSPYFSDPDNGNYMIQEYSPLRNAGIWNDDVPLYDLYGFERDSLPDIGCYEYDETSINNEQLIINNCKLYQNYPNPFNPSTTISFYISKTDKVELLLYNVAGQLVKKILDEELKAGSHSILFEASDINSGMYYYTLKTEDSKISKKMLLLK